MLRIVKRWTLLNRLFLLGHWWWKIFRKYDNLFIIVLTILTFFLLQNDIVSIFFNIFFFRKNVTFFYNCYLFIPLLTLIELINCLFWWVLACLLQIGRWHIFMINYFGYELIWTTLNSYYIVNKTKGSQKFLIVYLYIANNFSTYKFYCWCYL